MASLQVFAISLSISLALATCASFAIAGSQTPVRASIDGDRIVTTRKIQFVTGRVSVTAASAPVIARIAESMKSSAVNDFVIEAHTDSSGDEAQNLELSQARASAVIDALVRRGVDRTRLRGVGRGSAAPIVSPTSAEPWRNRRVEILIVMRSAPASDAIVLVPPAALAVAAPVIVVGLLDEDLESKPLQLALLEDQAADFFDLAPPRFLAVAGVRPLVGLIDADDGDLFVPAFGAQRNPAASRPNVKTLDD